MLIGVNGQLGSGKDATLERAQVLYDTGNLPGVPARPTRRAFADKLKQAVAALFDITLGFLEEAKRDDMCVAEIRRPRFGISRVRGLRWTRHLPGMTEVVASQTVRSVLQRMGTEVGRNLFGDTFWIDQCVPPGVPHNDKVIMVTDVRFPNEAQHIKDQGGTVIRVLNGPLVRDGHDSEQVLDDDLIDFELDNSIRGDDFNNLDALVQNVFKGARQTAAVRKVSRGKAIKVDSTVTPGQLDRLSAPQTLESSRD